MPRCLQRPRPLALLATASAMFCLAISTTGCGNSDAQPISAETSKYQVGDDNDSATGGGQSGTNPVTLEAGSPGTDRSPAQDRTAASDSAGQGRPDMLAGGAPPAGQPQQPPSLPGKALNEYTVPDGTPAELLQFISKLAQRQPQGTTEDEVLADFRNINDAVIAAADKILESDADESVRETAVQSKLNSLRVLAQLGTPDIMPRIRAFCQQLVQDKNLKMARLGRMVLFGIQVGDIAGGESDDVPSLMNEMNAMLSDKAWINQKDQGEQVFALSQQAALVLQQIGKHEDSSTAFRQIGEAFLQHENPDVARGANGLLEQAMLVQVEFEGKRDAALFDEPEAMAPFMTLVRELLGKPQPGPLLLRRMLDAGQYMEFTHHDAEAREIYTSVAKAYAGHSDAELVQDATSASANGLRRLDLIGKPFVVQGLTLDGQPLDWSQYQGKVVLVDFWASWCRPCLEEMPNIARYYEMYRDKGFEVIGVNLDENPEDRQRFFAARQLPWTTVISADPQAVGFSTPLAVSSGIDAIPFLVLVNQQGVAVALHTRGDELGERLAELLGPPTAPGAGTDPGAGAAPGAARPAGTGAPAPGTSSLRTDGEPTWFVSLQDDPADAADETETEPNPAEQRNPYLAASDLSPAELVDYLLDMEEKPQTIQRRPGFADAVAEAADRVLAAQASDKFHTIAALAKFRVLHDAASFDDAKADEQLVVFLKALKDDTRPKIAQEVRFLTLERRALDADEMPLDQLPALLDELAAFLAEQKLTERHLRMASATVHLVNRLEQEEAREKEFVRFGKMFAASSSKEMARYGKKLTKSSGPGSSELVGKPLELAGVTTDGDAFNWEAYRGKVVVVDFWATWCGPCRKAMPKVKALYEKQAERGFDVVGISLDQDLDALAEYLSENQIPWSNLSGEETQELAKKYGVRGIPTLMLVDAEGKVVAVTHNIDDLTGKIDQLLAGKVAAAK